MIRLAGCTFKLLPLLLLKSKQQLLIIALLFVSKRFKNRNMQLLTNVYQ